MSAGHDTGTLAGVASPEVGRLSEARTGPSPAAGSTLSVAYPPRGPLMLGTLLLRCRESTKASSAAAEACRAASSMLAHAWGECGSRDGPAAQ